jgi:hypothetical protein
MVGPGVVLPAQAQADGRILGSEAADYLLSRVMMGRLDVPLRVKLNTLRADLKAEQ